MRIKSVSILDCENLHQCEKKFEGLITSINLLGEIYLSEDNFEHIKKLYQEHWRFIRNEPAFLENEFPISTSLFLLYKGINDYHEGNFWDSIYNDLKIEDGHVRWNAIFGDIFYKVIRSFNLIEFEVGRNKYVSQILAHGFVPCFYWDEFFEKFLFKEFQNFLNGIFSLRDVEEKLKHIRNDHKKRLEFQKELQQLEERFQHQKKLIDKYEMAIQYWEEISEFNELLSKKSNKREIEELRKLPDNYFETLKEQVELLDRKIEKKRTQLSEINESIKHYSRIKERYEEQKEAIKNLKVNLNTLRKILEVNIKKLTNKDKVENFCDVLTQANLSSLKEAIEKYNYYTIKKKSDWNILNSIKFYLMKLMFVVTGKKRKKENKIKGFLRDLSLKESIICKPSNDIYETLILIKNYCCEIKEIKKELNKKMKNLKSFQEEVAATSEQDIGNLIQDFKRAEIKKQDILNEIQLLNEERKKMAENIKEYKMKLTIIGGGDIENGKFELESQIKIQNRIEELQKELNMIDEGMLKDLLYIVKSRRKEKIRKKIRHIKADKIVTENQIEEINTKKLDYTETLYPLNESTQIFLFQGGDIAEKFIYRCLIILKKIINSDLKILHYFKGNDIFLPKKLIIEMQDWWVNYQDKIEGSISSSKSNQSFVKKPYLKYSFRNKEVMIYVPLQEIKLKKEPDNFRSVIQLIKGEDILQELKVTILSVDKLRYQSKEMEIKIPAQPGNYNIKLYFNQQCMGSWEIKIEFPLFFKGEKILKNNILQSEQVGMVINNNLKIDPYDKIIQKDSLSGDWFEFNYYLLNTAETEYINIRNNQDDLLFSLYEKQNVKPHLTGGIIAVDFFCRQKQVYLEPPILVFSIERLERLKRIYLRIARGKQIKYYQLSKIQKYLDINGTIVHLPLKRIFKQKEYGLYEIILEKTGRYSQEWIFTIPYLPKINYKFDKEIYPVGKEKNYGQLELDLHSGYNFIPQNSKIINQLEQNKLMIQFDTSLSYIDGSLKYQTYEIPLSIAVPNLKWKLEGSKVNTHWSTKLTEFWFEDLLSQEEANIYLKFPFRFNNSQVDLLLNNGEQRIRAKINKSICKFNLMILSDNIRNNQNKMQSLYIKMHDLKASTGIFELMNIRTQWEVKNVIINQKRNEDNRILHITWEDMGKASNRILRIWNKSYPNKGPVYEQNIEEGKSELWISDKIDKFQVGQYRLQFDQIQTWGNPKIEFPHEGELNIVDVVIGGKDEFLNFMKKYGLKLLKAEDDDGNIFDVKEGFYVKNIMLSPEFEMEERYEGEVIILNKKLGKNEFEKMKYNPVSFYINTEGCYMPFLVDEGKDGAMYCKKCKKLFWELNHHHNKKEQLLTSKIYVKIDYEGEV